ncbi:MAG: FliA/WhiG family RNA polymerase sigma factor [Epulopiscium sp.]|nr:FliA/WhiG family RNA polymerase sigma factor [Candidatus Epulonipiscium sp.]
MNKENIEELWVNYVKTKSPHIKEKLIIEYSPLIKHVAGRLYMYLGQNVEYEDLIGYGVFGLIDAIDKFDLEKGVKFETYASLRIRGSILDHIRKMDWVPRSLRQKQKDVEKAYLDLEIELGRPAEDEEVAQKLKLSMSDFQDLLKQVNILSLISLEEYMDQNYEINLSFYQGSLEEQPANYVEQKELKQMLADTIDELPEREKQVIIFYYFEDMTLKEISYVLGVSESRISQLHTKALMRLKGKLGTQQGVLFGL